MDEQVVLINAPVDADSAMRGSPTLGMLYLGGVLKEQGIPVAFFDMHYEGESWADVEKAVAGAERCLVGFTCNSDNIHRVRLLSDRVLDRFPHASVALGGPHVTHVWEPYVTDRRFVVRGEGEYAMLLLTKHVLRDEGTLADIP